MFVIIICMMLIIGVSAPTHAGNLSFSVMYQQSFIDPVGFEQYINQNRGVLANQKVAQCLEHAGAFSKEALTYIDTCLVKGDTGYALICLNDDPVAATGVWSNSFYQSVFKSVPWTETAMGRTARYIQFSAGRLSGSQNSYLLRKGAALLSVCD